jgi:hypothetical protein
MWLYDASELQSLIAFFAHAGFGFWLPQEPAGSPH